MLIPDLKKLYTKAFQNWLGDNATRLAAAFSFYAMLCLSPMLVLGVAIASRVLGDSQAGMHFVHIAEGYLGHDGSMFIETMIQKSAKPGVSVIASLLSVAVAVYGATNLFGQLSDSVNAIWEVKSRSGIKGFLINKVVSVIMFLVFSAVFVSWLAIDSWLAWLAHSQGLHGRHILSMFISVIFLTFVFALSYRALPKGMVAWGDVWYGAATAALGFALSKYLLGLYFAYSSVSAAYGSAGALVIILLWIYYSAQIYFYGLELTCTYAHMHGSQVNRVKGDDPIPVAT